MRREERQKSNYKVSVIRVLFALVIVENCSLLVFFSDGAESLEENQTESETLFLFITRFVFAF